MPQLCLWCFTTLVEKILVTSYARYTFNFLLNKTSGRYGDSEYITILANESNINGGTRLDSGAGMSEV